MMESTSTSLDLCTAREEAALWGFLHDLFRPPSAEQWHWLHEESTAAAWALLAGRLGGGIAPNLPMPETQTAFEESYLAAFEVGLPHPPCPLIESHWNHRESVPKVLHENILFYRHFGLQVSQATLETADHLRFQLEFLYYLELLCADALENKQHANAEQIEQARADYMNRHLGWISEAAQACRKQLREGWPVEWMDLLAGCLARCSRR